MTTQLSILKTSIRTYENLYSLNDLHIASGGEDKHRPTFFIRLDTTKDLITELQNSDVQICTSPIKSLRTGINKGTWACEELVLAYAMWISPKFHLIVLRAFLAMHRGEVQPKQLALPEPEKTYTLEFTEYELQQLVWLWCGFKKMNELLGDLIDPLDNIGSRFSGQVYSHHHEYKRNYNETAPTIQRMIEPFKQSSRLNWTRAINIITQ